jgi:phosphotransferase system HPr (HPr) family protein
VQTLKGNANGKSLMSIMSLGINKGDEINLVVTGADEIQALAELENVLMGAR